jgi:ParB-like chromosome segregation protein Spo0J
MTETKKKYQVMPPLSDEEYQALKEDIAERRVMLPVVLDGEGNVIDGHHRIRAVEELRAEGRSVRDPITITRWDLETDEDKRDEAWRLNMQRRHLNREQKQEAIKRKLKESPEWADNRIAKLLGVDGKTVRFMRVMLEGRKEIAKVKKVVGADGKEYPREVEKSLKDKGLKPKFAKFLAESATLTREPAEGPLRWASAEVGEEQTEPREPGVIEQMEATAEGREAFAQINRDQVEGQARDRVLRRISDLYYLMREVPPEDVARDVVARHVGEAAENAVQGRATSGRNFALENAQAVHAWLGEFMRVIEEANARLRELSGKE